MEGGTAMKRVMIGLMVLVLAFCLAGGALGAKGAPDLTGTWSGSMMIAEWDTGTFSFNGPLEAVNFLIVSHFDAASGNFYGYWLGTPITGNVSTKKIISAIIYWGPDNHGTLDAQVKGTIISGTYKDFKTGRIYTGKINLVKQP
jgi:hypothetical protein